MKIIIALLFAVANFPSSALAERSDVYFPGKKIYWAPSSCPDEMAQVGKICVDKWEYPSRLGSRPEAFKSRDACVMACKAEKKRLLTDAEWKAACVGTKPKNCNIHSVHPILEAMKRATWNVAAHNSMKDCKKNPWIAECMNDPSLAGSWLWDNQDGECVSNAGIYNMVGNLGEWVSDNIGSVNGNGAVKVRGRFNGGLAPQPKSSCDYTTTAHDPQWSDYSIGCRCGKDL